MKKFLMGFLTLSILLAGPLAAFAENEEGRTQDQGFTLQEGQQVNINQASAMELEALPGVGPKLAQAIIQTRQEIGGFKSVNDLDQVPGIANKRLETIKTRATV